MNFGDPRLPQRFWDKCIPEPNSGCWLWLPASEQFFLHKYKGSQHRRCASALAYEAAFGPISGRPPSRCQVASCINPAHRRERIKLSYTQLVARQRERDRAARLLRPDEVREKHRAWVAGNRERLKAYQRARYPSDYSRNRERILARAAARRALDPAGARARSRGRITRKQWERIRSGRKKWERIRRNSDG